jgi:protein gp37
MTEARRRIPVLLRVPARVHWLSVAPLLEPLDLLPWLGSGIDWIVVGGRVARKMPATWSQIGRVICAISAMTGAPRSFSSRCGSDKRSLPT